MSSLFEDLSDREMHYMNIIRDLVNRDRRLSHSLRKRRNEDIEAARQWLRELPAEETAKILGNVLVKITR